MNLPEEYTKKLAELLKEDYSSYINSFQEKYGQTFRVNLLKTEPADFIRRFCFRKVPWCEQGYYYEGEERLSMNPLYYGGVYYLQEPSAMAPAAFLPVNPGEKVLDLCAAPGGKTTALAAKLRGEGIIVANDISVSRCKALVKNMEMAGITNGMVVSESPEKLSAKLPEFFDKILVDAPCSGEGMFRKDPSMIKNWSPEEVDKYSAIQKDIVKEALKMLKPGGQLLYSTCTFSPEEDEQTVEYMLELDEDLTLMELPLVGGISEGLPEWSVSGREELRKCRRFWPHRVRGEGHFAALLKKKAEDFGVRSMEKTENALQDESIECPMEDAMEGAVEMVLKEINVGNTDREFYKKMSCGDGNRKNQKKQKEKNKAGRKKSRGLESESGYDNAAIEDMLSFFKGCSLDISHGKIQFLEERVFLLPKDVPDLRGIRIVRSGLYLGDCKKKRFEPSQALAMALRVEEYRNVLSLEMDDPRIEHYLKCETIEADTPKGWTLVAVGNYPLGWGKSNGCQLKNKYPASWRKN